MPYEVFLGTEGGQALFRRSIDVWVEKACFKEVPFSSLFRNKQPYRARGRSRVDMQDNEDPMKDPALLADKVAANRPKVNQLYGSTQPTEALPAPTGARTQQCPSFMVYHISPRLAP